MIDLLLIWDFIISLLICNISLAWWFFWRKEFSKIELICICGIFLGFLSAIFQILAIWSDIKVVPKPHSYLWAGEVFINTCFGGLYLSHLCRKLLQFEIKW